MPSLDTRSPTIAKAVAVVCLNPERFQCRNLHDPLSGSVADTLTVSQHETICDNLFRDNTWQSLRKLVQHLMLLTCTMRGDESRKVKISHIFHVTDKSVVAEKETCVVCTMMREGKTNKHGVYNYAYALRHRDPSRCLVAMLGLYYLYLFDVKGEALDFSDETGNLGGKYLFAESEKPLTATTQSLQSNV